jgi:AcrR family transcriptional regulator
VPRPRFRKTDPARQAAILAAAAKEFAQVGYEGASLNRILAAAGLSKGAFYYYFDDKADLACTVLLWAYRDIFAMFDRADLPDRARAFWAAIHRLTHDSLERLERVPYSNQLMSRLGHAYVNDPQLAARMRKVVARATSAQVAIWKRGQALGAVRADLSPETLIGIGQGIKDALTRTWLGRDRVLTRRELARFADLQLDLVRRVSEPRKERAR